MSFVAAVVGLPRQFPSQVSCISLCFVRQCPRKRGRKAAPGPGPHAGPFMAPPDPLRSPPHSALGRPPFGGQKMAPKGAGQRVNPNSVRRSTRGRTASMRPGNDTTSKSPKVAKCVSIAGDTRNNGTTAVGLHPLPAGFGPGKWAPFWGHPPGPAARLVSGPPHRPHRASEVYVYLCMHIHVCIRNLNL